MVGAFEGGGGGVPEWKDMAPLQPWGRFWFNGILIVPPLTTRNICLCVEQSEDTQELDGERFEHRRPSKLEDHNSGNASSQLHALKLKLVKIHQRVIRLFNIA